MPMVESTQADHSYKVLGAIDWTTQGEVSQVKNQGQCGCGYAFSAVTNM